MSDLEIVFFLFGIIIGASFIAILFFFSKKNNNDFDNDIKSLKSEFDTVSTSIKDLKNFLEMILRMISLPRTF